jgi:molybdopterin synthase catalytic subunit
MTLPALALVAIRDVPLDLDEVMRSLDDPSSGGVTVFVGRVRDHDAGRSVTALEYEAHPTALARLEEVCRQIAQEYDVRVAAVHRVGRLELGDAAVIVAAAGGHRDAPFLASRALIDTLKATVPIWKHQLFVDGTQEWVGAP